MSKNNSPNTLHIKELNLELLQPNTKTYMNPDQGGSKHVVIGKPGCFARGTKVLMYDGEIKNVENIEIGEQVMGDDSRPRNVIELCRNNDIMYKVLPNKGDSVVVNENHILSLKCTGYNQIPKGQILDISVKDFLAKSQEFREKYKWYRKAVDFKEQKLDVHPYMFGYWLGDNTSYCDQNTTVDKEVVKIFESMLSEMKLLFNESQSAPYHYQIKQENITSKSENSFLNTLRKLDVLNDKHIPSLYKINSRPNRLQLLAGLIDSDGCYDTEGEGFDIVLKSEKLLDDIIFVARSLGFAAYKKKCLKRCTDVDNHIGEYYRCFISGDVSEIPCQITRKQAKEHKRQTDVLVTGFELQKLEEDQYYGFTLDGNHRFLLDDFSVVHNTGKSTLISALLYSKKHIYPCGVVFSGTEDSNGFYKRMFPDTFIFNKYDENQLKSFIQRQKISKKHVSNPWAVCLLDDCTDTPAVFNKPLQQGIYKNSRHWKMWYILSLQYCMDVKPVIRTNVDGTFILREPNLKNRRSLWENYAGIIPDFSQFCEIMDQITNDYTALYIHNATRSNNLEDCLFWFKAKPVPSGFKFGSPDFWEFHYARYNSDYVEPFLP